MTRSVRDEAGVVHEAYPSHTDPRNCVKTRCYSRVFLASAATHDDVTCVTCATLMLRYGPFTS